VCVCVCVMTLCMHVERFRLVCQADQEPAQKGVCACMYVCACVSLSYACMSSASDLCVKLVKSQDKKVCVCACVS